MTRAQAEALIAYVEEMILAKQPGAGAGAWQRMEAARAAFLATVDEPPRIGLVHHWLEGVVPRPLERAAVVTDCGLAVRDDPAVAVTWTRVTCPACRAAPP